MNVHLINHVVMVNAEVQQVSHHVVHATIIVYPKEPIFVVMVNARVQQELVVVDHVRMIVVHWDCVVQEHVPISRMSKLVDRASINVQAVKFVFQIFSLVMIHQPIVV